MKCLLQRVKSSIADGPMPTIDDSPSAFFCLIAELLSKLESYGALLERQRYAALVKGAKAQMAVSAFTLTCRLPAVPRSCWMLSMYMAVRVRPFPRLPPPET